MAWLWIYGPCPTNHSLAISSCAALAAYGTENKWCCPLRSCQHGEAYDSCATWRSNWGLLRHNLDLWSQNWLRVQRSTTATSNWSAAKVVLRRIRTVQIYIVWVSITVEAAKLFNSLAGSTHTAKLAEAFLADCSKLSSHTWICTAVPIKPLANKNEVLKQS